MPNFPPEVSENIEDQRGDSGPMGPRFGSSPSIANYTTIRNGQLARTATPSEDKSDTQYDLGPPSKSAEVRRSPKTRRGKTDTPYDKSHGAMDTDSDTSTPPDRMKSRYGE